MTNEMPNEIYVTEPVKGTGTGFYAQTDFDGSTKYIRADIAQTVNQELLDALKWYVENDDTYEGDWTSDGGQNWDVINSYWIEGRKRAEQVIARATPQIDVQKLKRNYAGLDDYNHAGKSHVDGWNAAIDYLSASGYLREPLPRIEGLEEDLKMPIDSYNGAAEKAARAYAKLQGGKE